jgi:orotidine-5'-phosphate decarboxylase
MNRQELFELILSKRSFLCVGLDTDINKIPAFLLEKEDPVFEFNKAIIDATLPFTVAYKPNLAFYEAGGLNGWRSLEKTIEYIRTLDQPVFLIADAKRGDIGNTSGMYARAFFDSMDFDAVTLSPYMGFDTVSPFLKYAGKWSVLLALTSNTSAADFQYFENDKGQRLFEKVLETSRSWGTTDDLMYVVGATRAESLQDVRKIVPDHFLLVPGVGAQGGSLEEVAKYGMNDHCGLLVNSSRGVIYAGNGQDYAGKATLAAKELKDQMEKLLKEKGLL